MSCVYPVAYFKAYPSKNGDLIWGVFRLLSRIPWSPAYKYYRTIWGIASSLEASQIGLSSW